MATTRKHTAISLHLGLNAVDPAAYSGWDGLLDACEFDAKDMQSIAVSRGIKPRTLLTKDATRAKALDAIRGAAKTLKRGDYFLLSYSGHGGQVDDVSGDEDDRQDETWCLYDGQLIDDELYYELGRFAAGVRIFVLSDSCHSGTVVRVAPPEGKPATKPRLMPPSIARKVYEEHRKFYDDLQKAITKKAGKDDVLEPETGPPAAAVSKRLMSISNNFKAQLILISGCQDRQTSGDGPRNGVFTGQLRRVWNDGHFTGNYAQFHARIKAGMPTDQTPNLFSLGNVAKFVLENPFKA
ncbi:MAG: caspase family protein [Usitatibacter sp.]